MIYIYIFCTIFSHCPAIVPDMIMLCPCDIFYGPRGHRDSVSFERCLEADDVWECVALGCTLLEGEDDSPIFAEFTNETFLLTQATTEDM